MQLNVNKSKNDRSDGVSFNRLGLESVEMNVYDFLSTSFLKKETFWSFFKGANASIISYFRGSKLTDR